MNRSVAATLPISYAVEGTVPGARAVRHYLVTEAVPVMLDVVEVDEIEPVPLHDPGAAFAVARRRPWLAVADADGEPIRDARALEAYAARTVSEGASGSGDFHPVDPIAGALYHRRLPVQAGEDWSSRFRRIEWTDRDAAVQAAIRSPRLAFVGDALRTDRFEPFMGFGRSCLVDVRNQRRLPDGDTDLRVGAWLATPPTAGMLAGRIDWETDPNVGCAAFLAKECGGFLRLDGRSEATFLHVAAGHRVMTAFAAMQAVLTCVETGIPAAMGREDLERLLEPFEALRGIEDPRVVLQLRSIVGRVDEVRECLDAWDEALQTVPAIDEDAIALYGAGA